MKTREFTIYTQEFGLNYNEKLNIDLLKEYLLEDLEVPEDYIESLNINDEYVSIKLSPKVKYFNDDWYVNLQRVS